MVVASSQFFRVVLQIGPLALLYVPLHDPAAVSFAGSARFGRSWFYGFAMRRTLVMVCWRWTRGAS